jgi:hypothetical protein
MNEIKDPLVEHASHLVCNQWIIQNVRLRTFFRKTLKNLNFNLCDRADIPAQES